MNETVTIVNRTSKLLHGTWDGKPHDLPPGEYRCSRLEALAFRFQNPVMGRGTPLEDWASKSEYLIGIVDDGDDISPIEQSSAPQRWDSGLVNGSNVEVIRPRGGGFSPEQRSILSPAGDEGFVKP